MNSSESTERRFLSSTLASYASLLVRLVVNFASRIVLARLILPEGHGLYEEALYILTIAGALRDLGLVHHLLRGDRKPYGTVLAFTTATGAMLVALLMIGAPVFAFLNPELPGVLRVFSIWLLLDGLMMVPRTFFERELRIGRLVVPEVLRGLVVAAVAIALAALGWEVWSLVWGEISAAALFAVLVWWRAKGHMPLELRWNLLPGLLRSSRWLFAVWIVVQLVSRVDLVIVEWFADTGTVGQYARAYGIVLLVPMLVAPRALLPALVEYRDDAKRFFETFRFGAVLLLFAQVCAAYFLFFNAHKTVAILLGPNWSSAVPLLQVLCFFPLLDISGDLGGEVLKVRHEDRIWLLSLLLNLVCLVVLGSLLTSRYGALGMAWANFLPLGNLVIAVRVAMVLGSRFRGFLLDVLLIYLAPLPFFLVVAWLLPSDSWGRFAAGFVAAPLAASLLAARFYRPFRSFFGLAGRRAP